MFRVDAAILLCLRACIAMRRMSFAQFWYTLFRMSMLLRASALLLCLSVAASARAQEPATPPQRTATANSPGQAILQRKCAQCHAATMWTALRQDRRAWESTLYRMVGRGALWTPEEINAMADYLAQIRGSTSANTSVDKPTK